MSTGKTMRIISVDFLKKVILNLIFCHFYILFYVHTGVGQSSQENDGEHLSSLSHVNLAKLVYVRLRQRRACRKKQELLEPILSFQHLM